MSGQAKKQYKMGQDGFWFLEPEPLDGLLIGKAHYTQKYQSYLRKKKKRKKPEEIGKNTSRRQGITKKC